MPGGAWPCRLGWSRLFKLFLSLLILFLFSVALIWEKRARELLRCVLLQVIAKRWAGLREASWAPPTGPRSAQGAVLGSFCPGCLQQARLCVHTQLAAQSCLTLCDPTDCRLPGSSVHGVFQARTLEWVAFPTPGDLSHTGIEPPSLVSPASAGELYRWPLGSPHSRHGHYFLNFFYGPVVSGAH